MSKEQNTSKKWRKINKSKNALKQVARLTPKCPNGKLSFLWDINPCQMNWFGLENQKMIGGKNVQANFSEPSENRVFGICRIKKGPDPKSFNVKFFLYLWVQLGLKRKKICFYNMVRRAIFCYPSNLPYFEQKGVPLPPRGVRGGQLDYPWNQCQ